MLRHLLSLATLAAIVAAGACGSSDDSGGGGNGHTAGTEGGACLPGNQCNAGLICLSDLCVEPPDASGSGATGGGGSAGTSTGGTSAGGTGAQSGSAGTSTGGTSSGGSAAGGTSSAGSSAGGSSAGGAAGSAGSAATGGSGGDACLGSHPQLDAGRFCLPGDCYCAKPDRCYPAAVADQCCETAPLCSDDGGIVGCKGRHADGDPGNRSCQSGECYCPTTDQCFAAGVASSCCAEQPQCF